MPTSVPASETIKVHCPYCNHEAPCAVMHKFSSTKLDKLADLGKPFYVFQLLKCLNCELGILTTTRVDWGEKQGDQETTFEVYPRAIQTVDKDVPPNLASIFQEAIVCHANKAYRATAILCRRVLEDSLVGMGITKGSLFDKINEANKQGKLSPALKDFATGIREIGNDGAHPNIDEVDAEAAEAIVGFVTYYLQSVYVEPARLQRAMSGRKKGP